LRSCILIHMKIDIQYIADLARIHIDEGKKASLEQDFESILSYVDSIQAVNLSGDISVPQFAMNQTREDIAETQDSSVRNALLGNMPKRSGDGLLVQNIL